MPPMCSLTYLAGNVIIKEGDVGTAMYIIRSGTAEITVDGEVIRALVR